VNSVARRRFDGISRSFLEAQILELEAKLALVERDRDQYLANLTATQGRCTTLLQEVRDYRALDDVDGGQARVLHDVVQERRRQDERWGKLAQRADVPDFPDTSHVAPDQLEAEAGVNLSFARHSAERHCKETGRETCCWFHVLWEEVEEAFAEKDPKRLREELVQVAAVAVCWIEALDRRVSK